MKQTITLALVIFTLIVASFTAPLDDQEDDFQDDTVMDGPGTEGSGSDMVVEPPQDANVMDGPRDDNDMDGPTKEGSLGDNDMDGPVYDNNMNENYDYQDMDGGCGGNGTIIKETPQEVCRDKQADVVFLLDRSTSVNEETWRQELNFTAEFISLFEIPNLRVALISFGYSSRVEIELSDYNSFGSKAELIRKVLETRNPRWHGDTNTAAALRKVMNYGFTRKGTRDGVPRYVVVLTDGGGQMWTQTRRARDELVRNSKAEIFAVGLGNNLMSRMLTDISSSEDNTLVVESTDHKDLMRTRDDLAFMLCGDVYLPKDD